MSDRISRFVRYLELLKTGRGYTIAQLAQLTNVHRRTVFRDMAALRSLGIEFTHDPETYLYSVKQFNDATEAIRADDMVALFTASLRSASTGLADGVTIRRAIERLAACLPSDVRKRALKLVDQVAEETCVSMNLLVDGVVEVVATAIRERAPLVVNLKPPASPANDVRLAPLELIFRNSGWWLLASGEPDGQTLEIPLHSISKARVGRSPLDWPRVTTPARDERPPNPISSSQ